MLMLLLGGTLPGDLEGLGGGGGGGRRGGDDATGNFCSESLNVSSSLSLLLLYSLEPPLDELLDTLSPSDMAFLVEDDSWNV